MGDLLSKEMLGDLIINIINIAILFFVTKTLLYKPVKKALDSRRAAQAKLLEEAEQLKTHARENKEKYDALMADTAAIRLSAMQEAEKQAQAKAEEILAEARAQAAEITESTRTRAEAERAKLLSDSKEQLGAVAVELSGKILAREVTDEDNRRIIDSFFGA